jgi:hypothetical protein
MHSKVSRLRTLIRFIIFSSCQFSVCLWLSDIRNMSLISLKRKIFLFTRESEFVWKKIEITDGMLLMSNNLRYVYFSVIIMLSFVKVLLRCYSAVYLITFVVMQKESIEKYFKILFEPKISIQNENVWNNFLK